MKPSLFSPLCLRAACIAGLVLYLTRAWEICLTWEVFRGPGLDYAIFGATAEAVSGSGWSSLYSKEAVTRAFAGWLEGRFDLSNPSLFVASPYPAPFLLPFFATNLLGHLGGFLAWTAINIGLYAAIVRGLTRGAGRGDPLTGLAPFVFLPFLHCLVLGQLIIMMTVGLYRSLLAFERGREFAAGCWLGLLLLKPQFGLILALVLLVKRRWSALAGLGLVGAGLAASTFALVGVGGVRDYLDILHCFSGFRRVPDIVYPWDMINFRGALANILPDSWGEDQATRLVLALSAAMTLSLVPIWRGRWEPRGERFPRQIMATMIVALFTSFHSHIHAATLLMVPMLADARGRREPDPLASLYVILILGPTYAFSIHGSLEWAAFSMIAVMATIYVGILAYPGTDRVDGPALGASDDRSLSGRRFGPIPHGLRAGYLGGVER